MLSDIGMLQDYKIQSILEGQTNENSVQVYKTMLYRYVSIKRKMFYSDEGYHLAASAQKVPPYVGVGQFFFYCSHKIGCRDHSIIGLGIVYVRMNVCSPHQIY